MYARSFGFERCAPAALPTRISRRALLSARSCARAEHAKEQGSRESVSLNTISERFAFKCRQVKQMQEENDLSGAQAQSKAACEELAQDNRAAVAEAGGAGSLWADSPAASGKGENPRWGRPKGSGALPAPLIWGAFNAQGFSTGVVFQL